MLAIVSPPFTVAEASDREMAIPADKTVAIPTDKTVAIPTDKTVPVPTDKTVAVPTDTPGAISPESNIADSHAGEQTSKPPEKKARVSQEETIPG